MEYNVERERPSPIIYFAPNEIASHKLFHNSTLWLLDNLPHEERFWLEANVTKLNALQPSIFTRGQF